MNKDGSIPEDKNEFFFSPSKDEEYLKAFSLIFDWKNRFHSLIPEVHLNKSIQTIESKKILERIVKSKDWKKKLMNRKKFYFNFISYWAKQVKVYNNIKNFPWEEVPGYSNIIKSFMQILNEWTFYKKCRNEMIESSLVLITNDKLLTQFVRTIFINCK